MNKNSPFSSEDVLVSFLKNNDRAAFEYVYDHYSPALYGIVCKIVSDDQKANDVMQEAFLKIWKNISSYDKAKGSLFTWMLNVTRHTAIDTLRADVKYATSKQLDKITETELDPVCIYQPSIATIDLRSFVEKLLPERKQVIELVYFKGYTHEEASETLKLPLGTVKSRIRVSLQEMRRLFEIPQPQIRVA